MTLFLLACIDCQAAKKFSKAVLLHETSGSHVSFLVPPGTRSASLQGWVAKTKRWVRLSSRRFTEEGAGTLRIPRRWQQRSLRVLATMQAGESVRVPMEFEISEDGRALTFFASHGEARLYSIESAEHDSSGWRRVSTVAAPATGAPLLRIPLPKGLPPDTRLRVMAVSGAPDGSLLNPLSRRLGRGPALFGGYSAFGELVSSLASMSQGVAATADDRSAPAEEDSAPAVDRSDIWGIRGARIYFFNQLRGLQIINATDRANPRLVGQLDLPAVGEEMYLLGGDSEEAGDALLVCRASQELGEPEFTRVLLVNVSADLPREQAAIEVPGHFVESRLAGTVLHLVTKAWEEQNGRWRPRTWLTSLDFGVQGTIVQTAQEELDFSVAQVGATAHYLWISGPDAGDWSSHRLYAWPLRVDGTRGEPRTARLGGVLQDKFKVGDVNGGLAAVVQSWRSPDGGWQRVTAVETFADDGAGTLASLARLELVRDESLFATRFDGSRLYAVTFRRVDPLWLVDLADPAAPAIVSELEVPGWSSFIEPMGDVLVAVGREDSRVQISLFDVTDPAAPALSQRVYLGSGFSWSEAEQDERAVRILRDEGLILLPVSESDAGQQTDKVALVEFDPEKLTLRQRGSIDHAFTPRRAGPLAGSAIASVSNRELLLVDASDRDNPLLTAQIDLAFGCQFVAVKDGTAYILESGRRGSSGDGGRAALRIAPVADTEAVTRTIRLEGSSVAAAAVFGNRLCIVETEYFDDFVLALTPDLASSTRSGSFLSVWSLADSQTPALLGRIALAGSFRGEVELLEVADGMIAIAGRQADWMLWPVPLFARDGSMSAAETLADVRIGFPWPGWNRNSLSVDIVDISASPQAVGFWSLGGEDISSISSVYSAGDLLVFSFVRSVSVPHLLPGGTLFTGAGSIAAPDDWSPVARCASLQILDLADPTAPMPWSPVEIPGELLGVAWLQRSGGLIFAKSGETGDRVAALGFDGEVASLAAEVEVGTGPATTSGQSLFAAHPGGVREWSFSEQKAKWERGPGWSFASGNGLGVPHPMDGALLVASAGRVWALYEDGMIKTAPTPGWARVSHAGQSDHLFLIPSGDYGAVSLGVPPP